MKINVYDQQGKPTGSTVLPKEIFGVPMNAVLVHQVVLSQIANRRQGSAQAKDRSQVRGGGRKPWRQKGTGRARHGSRRSPIWRGGGVTFGPLNQRVFKKKINQKIKRKALLMILSAKAKNDLLIVVDDLKLEKPKTKLMAGLLKKLPCQGKSSLIALPGLDKNVIISSKNLTEAETIQAKDLNALDLLNFKYLIIPKTAVKVIKETFLK